jgi:sarcosine oxidase
MSDHFDVIVIGVGAMGAAACWRLAQRGCRVLGLDQFGIPNAMGSSHGESRVIRLCYYEHPDYVPLLHQSYEDWAELERDGGESLLTLTGALYMGHEDGPFITGTLRSARRHDLPHEVLSRDEIAGRFPQFRLPAGLMGVWEPRAGMLRPEVSISAMARLALMHGADLRGHEAVLHWQSEGDAIRVRTSRGEHSASQVIFTAGSWAPRLLRDLGVPLQATRQPAAWVWPRAPELFTPDRFPIWGIEDPDGFFYYGFPLQPGRVGLKAARHYLGAPADPDTIDRTPGPADEAEIRAALRQYLPDGDGPVLSMSICMYTNSPDGHFIIDRHPRMPQVLVATGFTGHGFKFAPVVGRILADLALDGATRLPATFLGLARFGRP